MSRYCSKPGYENGTTYKPLLWRLTYRDSVPHGDPLNIEWFRSEEEAFLRAYALRQDGLQILNVDNYSD